MRRTTAVGSIAILLGTVLALPGCRHDVRTVYRFDLEGRDRIREVAVLNARAPGIRFEEMFLPVPGAKVAHPFEIVEPRAAEGLGLVAETSGPRGHFSDSGKDYLDAKLLRGLAVHVHTALAECRGHEVVMIKLGRRNIYLRGLRPHDGTYRILQVCGTPKPDAEPDCYGIIVPPSGPLELMR
jgi:hypothetical protein